MRKQKTYAKLTSQETESFKQAIENATTKSEIYDIAGKLNNHPYHWNQDHVSFLAILDLNESKASCRWLLSMIS
jgi:hypothetical protein